MQADGWAAQKTRVAKAPRIYRGLSVRLSAELGLGRTDRELSVGKTKLSGLDGGISFEVGTSAADNLILYGRLAGFSFNHALNSDSPNVGAAYYGLIGAGARYHFMPFDWYGSGTLVLVAMSVTGNLGQVENADPGFGVQLETGKNWPSGAEGDRGEVGLGLRFSYLNCGSVGGNSKPWITTAYTLVFSVSYN